MSDADAEECRAAVDRVANRGVDAVLEQPAHRSGEAADAGKNELRRAGDGRGIARDVQIGARRAERARDVRGVRDRRVDQGDAQMTPFVLGMSLDTTAFASRTAIANALKIASAL